MQSEIVKARALELGFDVAGIAPAAPASHANYYRKWLASGYAGQMAYLAKDPDRRADPRAILPGARSIIACGISYHNKIGAPPQTDEPRGRVARYALGIDYHSVLRGRLLDLAGFVREESAGAVTCYACVDTAPVLEKDASCLAGIGWFGKNTSLVHPALGSWYFLSILLLDTDLAYDSPIPGRCGKCTRCVDSCPTGALLAPYVMDARRCISYLTIELKGAIPRELRPLLGNRIFGCDLCQEACPWNGERARTTKAYAFQCHPDAAFPPLLPLLGLDEEAFRARFQGTAILRTRRSGLLRNVAVALGNLEVREAAPALAGLLAGDPEPLVRGHSAWALGRIGGRKAAAGLERSLASEADPWVLEEVRAAMEGRSYE